MQLDFQQFLMKLEKLTDIRPIPDKEFVETYIKAYYLTENDMERWIKEHRVGRDCGCLEREGLNFLNYLKSLVNKNLQKYLYNCLELSLL